jgi:hypothetical protein
VWPLYQPRFLPLLHTDVDGVAIVTATTLIMLLLMLPIAASSGYDAIIGVHALDCDVATLTGGKCFSSTPTNCTWLEGDVRDRRSVL